ncbi:hypothetical protein EB1_33630 [Empedobacter brevis NBRC 14943 = ATCC 43319]|uniref:Uncharacterized protein n=1 Tax=Empedobacter brevis NBRC 14943 = ATCC 43319 TaxID=1218108 RepID=A0A511NLB0_9FLAO|nr:DUF6520 family protein [Empedobacter brevis]GEM53573.1 hypothetical protein EB1_33630 [Empedobacter brevis NBRC 14943 = ATCC 43319]
MKTNFLKKALPIGVGMMAVAFAFATESKTSQNNEEEVLMTGYIYNSATNHCDDVKVDCSTTIGLPCTVNENGIEKDVFELRDVSETSCSIPLYRQ